MKCIYCESEIEVDDNFCPNCGHWTARGYLFLNNKSNLNEMTKGNMYKKDKSFTLLITLFFVSLLLFLSFYIIRGDDLFRPIAFLKKELTSHIYGYKTTLIKTDNKYNRVAINTYDEAIKYIQKDFDKQSYLCNSNFDLYKIEAYLEDKYFIPSVVFCDMSVDNANKIANVINRIYTLFPNINGALTNITITNAINDSEYIARFQPMYQFVNINEDINNYNKVNKTQILLNSYYFLNQDILSKPVENIVNKNWYVDGVTWESTIAHELGHYISFKSFLKQNDLDNITFENSQNYQKINDLLQAFDSGHYSNQILTEALNNYNLKYHTNLNLDDFAMTISNYAAVKDKNNNLIADETIAEAVHDYYLHDINMNKSSLEIIKVLKKRLE